MNQATFVLNTAERDRNWKLAWLYFGAIMLAYSVVILTAKTPPHSVDYPNWVYQGVLFRDVVMGHPVHGYAMKHYPVPFSSTTIVVGLLNTMMSWQLAGKLWICFYLALAGVATWMLADALEISSPFVVVVLPAVTFLNLEFWWGRIGFETGMCLVMIFIALLLRGVRPAVLSVLLVAIYFSHMHTCACALLFLGLWVLCTGQWRKLWLAAPTIVLCAWYAVARFAGGNADGESVPSSNWAYGSGAFFLFKANTYLKIFSYVNARTPLGLSQSESIVCKDMFLALIALSACLALLCLGLVVRGALSYARADRAAARRTKGDRQSVGLFVLILVPASLLVPQVFLGSTDPGSRLVIMGVAVGLFLVDWRGLAGKLVAGLSVVVCLANLYQFALLDHSPEHPGHAQDIPALLMNFAHVEPAVADAFYEHLERGEMDLDISTTAMFLQKNDAR